MFSVTLDIVLVAWHWDLRGLQQLQKEGSPLSHSHMPFFRRRVVVGPWERQCAIRTPAVS